MREEHTDDLRNVNEGDNLTITTTEGRTIDVYCAMRQTQNADPRSGEVRETKIWEFRTSTGIDGHVSFYASILDGLRSSPDDPEFPQHSALSNEERDINLGYIEEIQIHGKMEA